MSLRYLVCLFIFTWAVTATAADTTCGLAECQVIEPPLAPAPALTAGQGIVQAAVWNRDQWVKNRQHILAPSKSWGPVSTVREMRINWSEIEPAPGQYEWAALRAAIDAAWAETPRKQTILRFMTYARKTKPAPGAILDAIPSWFMTAAKRRGPQCTGIGTAPTFAGTPKGCTWYEARTTGDCNPGEVCEHLTYFNPNEPPAQGMSYQERALALIAAFQAAFDTPEYRHKLLAIDIGLIGTSGEQETGNSYLQDGQNNLPVANADYGQALVDAWWEIDDRIQITTTFQFAFENGIMGGARFQAPKTGWIYVCRKAAEEAPGGQLAGWRNDGLNAPAVGNHGKTLLNNLAADPVLANCWRTGSLNGEPMRQYAYTDAEDPQDDLRGALNWWAGVDPYLYQGVSYPPIHGSLFNAKYSNLEQFATERQAFIRAWPTRVGYRLHPTRVVLPGVVAESAQWNLLVEMANIGTTPFHSRWHQLRARFTALSGVSYEEDLPLDLTQLSLNQTRTAVLCGLRLPAGLYQIEIGLGPVPVISENTPAYLSLANCQTYPNGATWCPIGTLTVTADATN